MMISMKTAMEKDLGPQIDAFLELSPNRQSHVSVALSYKSAALIGPNQCSATAGEGLLGEIVAPLVVLLSSLIFITVLVLIVLIIILLCLKKKVRRRQEERERYYALHTH